jgi:hypothetical protein
MSFPTYGFTTKVDNVDTIMAADVNGLQSAVQEIADIVDALPSGGGATFPMSETLWYSPASAIGGSYAEDENEVVVGGDIAYAVPIRLYEPCKIAKVSIQTPYAPASNATVRFALHMPSVSAGAGVKIDDLGTATIPDTNNGSSFYETSVAATDELAAGWYFIVIASNVDISLPFLAVSPTGFSGPIPTEPYEGPCLSFEIEETGIGSAIPSDLTSATHGLDNKCPYFLFQISH